jgi:uncharacterized Zn-finger protein
MKRPYECKYHDCDKKFTTRFSLRRHVATHAPAKQYICVICYKKFSLSQYLKEHTYIHTGQKPFKCPYEGCTKAFRQAGKLSLHKKLHENKIFLVQKVKRRPVSNDTLSTEQSSLKKQEDIMLPYSSNDASQDVPLSSRPLPTVQELVDSLSQSYTFPVMLLTR